MPNLFEIDEQIRALDEDGFDMECVDTETGEIVPELVAARLDSLQMDETRKMESIAMLIKEREAMAASIKEEMDALTKRRKACQNKAEALKRYLLDYMTLREMKRKETARCVITAAKKSPSLEVVDPAALIDWAALYGEQYLTYAAPKPKVAEIKAAVKEGVPVPGVRLVDGTSLRIV